MLEAPSHVILNHANCWTENNPTLAPVADRQGGINAAHNIQVQEVDDGRTSSQEKDDKGMTAVSLTLRLNVNKFATLTYYRPKM